MLEIAYEDSGSLAGDPVVLLHGYPFDVRAFDDVVPVLVGRGMRCIVPYLRGFGPTRFLSAETMRSGEQAAIGQDTLDLLDALGLSTVTLAGFDWGARAACIVAAQWPARVRALVTVAGYQIQDIAQAGAPLDPVQERRYWYQHYLQTERGRRAQRDMRAQLSRYLWQLWSPTWKFDDATFNKSVGSLDNPDFVDIAVHSYRHRLGNASGDPRHAALEAQLSRQPKIGVPSIALHGADDDVMPQQMSADHQRFFTGPYQRRLLAGVGHNPPQEAPAAFAQAVLDARALTQ